MKLKYLITLSIILLSASNFYSQNYPHVKKAYIKCYVTHENNDSLYYYNYSVKNDISSNGKIFSFEIDISLKPKVISDTAGLKFRFDFERSEFRDSYPGKEGKLVPVGYWCPDRWHGGLSYLFFAHINGFPEILPGITKSGYKINAKAIPSIRKVILSPSEVDVIDLMPSIEDTNRTLSIPQMDSIRAACKYQTWTIGPNLFPKDYPLTTIIDSIKSYTERSAILKWIVDKKEDDKEKHDEEKGGKLVKELITYLGKAREQLAKNEIKEAKKQLEKFVEKVEENYKESNEDDDRKEISEHSYLTSEAYALLKYNAEYLILKLK